MYTNFLKINHLLLLNSQRTRSAVVGDVLEVKLTAVGKKYSEQCDSKKTCVDYDSRVTEVTTPR